MRTLILHGDTYFTDDAMETIVKHPTRCFKLFARPHPNSFTGRHWGECFAFSFWPEHIPAFLKAFERVTDLYEAKVATRIGGWEVYKAFLGEDDVSIAEREARNVGMLIEIHDWTDDFDHPDDYGGFMRRRESKQCPGDNCR